MTAGGGARGTVGTQLQKEGNEWQMNGNRSFRTCAHCSDARGRMGVKKEWKSLGGPDGAGRLDSTPPGRGAPRIFVYLGGGKGISTGGVFGVMVGGGGVEGGGVLH